MKLRETKSDSQQQRCRHTIESTKKIKAMFNSLSLEAIIKENNYWIFSKRFVMMGVMDLERLSEGHSKL